MEYYTAADYKTGNFHITVRRPVLTPEEHDRRMKIIHDAAARLLQDVYAKREAKNNAKGA